MLKVDVLMFVQVVGLEEFGVQEAEELELQPLDVLVGEGALDLARAGGDALQVLVVDDVLVGHVAVDLPLCVLGGGQQDLPELLLEVLPEHLVLLHQFLEKLGRGAVGHLHDLAAVEVIQARVLLKQFGDSLESLFHN